MEVPAEELLRLSKCQRYNENPALRDWLKSQYAYYCLLFGNLDDFGNTKLFERNVSEDDPGIEPECTIDELDRIAKKGNWMYNRDLLQWICEQYGLYCIMNDQKTDFGNEAFFKAVADHQLGGSRVLPYTITKGSLVNVKRFNTNAQTYHLDFNTVSISKDNVKKAFDDIIVQLKSNCSDKSLFGLKVTTNELSYPILVPFSPANKFNSFNILNVIEAVSQSQRALNCLKNVNLLFTVVNKK